jgi:hypothetical protein
MRTNIDIDDALLNEAFSFSNAKTRNTIVFFCTGTKTLSVWPEYDHYYRSTFNGADPQVIIGGLA